METKKDQSYGVIPVVQENGIWKVFLIYQYGSKGDVYWTFPKGHPEGGEMPEAAARRELQEETGIALEKLDVEHTYTQSYSFPFKEVLIEKSVTYYLGFAKHTDFILQEEEVKEGGWFSIEEAKEKVTYAASKELLETVAADLLLAS